MADENKWEIKLGFDINVPADKIYFIVVHININVNVFLFYFFIHFITNDFKCMISITHLSTPHIYNTYKLIL